MQNLQGSDCVRVSFLIELQASGLQLKKRDSDTLFSNEHLRLAHPFFHAYLIPWICLLHSDTELSRYFKYLEILVFFLLNTHLYRQLRPGSSPKSFYFQDFQCSKLLNGCLVVWPNKQIFKYVPWIFKHLSLTYCIPLMKVQITFLWNL